MRLFYRIMPLSYRNNCSSQWAEIDHMKAGVLGGDYIICHTEDLRDRFLGERLVMGIEFNVVLPENSPYRFNKEVAALIFFTKIPKEVELLHSNKNDAGKDVIVTFTDDWFDAL